MTKHAIRKPKAYKGERTWPEILEATGPLINFLESVSNQVAAKWRGSVPPSIYGVTVDGREVATAIQREGRRDVPEVPEGLPWAMILHGHLETEFGPLAARVAVVEAWAVNDLDGLPDVRPREHPARKEVVILEAACPSGKLHGMRDIIRKNGKAMLGPLWIAERDGVRGDETIQ
jgi:hypothetical protein